MNDLDAIIIETALRKMVNGGYLSISTINEIVKLKRIIPDAQVYQRLSLLHCVHFSDMPPEVRDALPGMIRQVLTGIEFDAEAIFQANRPGARPVPAALIDIEPEPRRRFLRLFKP